jgi:hypothetical protein
MSLDIRLKSRLSPAGLGVIVMRAKASGISVGLQQVIT